MVVNKSCVAACQKSVRMTVESVSGCSWNECPDQRGITVRMRVEWVSESAWNPQTCCMRLGLVTSGDNPEPVHSVLRNTSAEPGRLGGYVRQTHP